MSDKLYIMEKNIKIFSIEHSVTLDRDSRKYGKNYEGLCYVNTNPKPENMDAPTQIDCFAIILYEQGDLKIKCNLKDYNIKPMSILFAPPGTILQMLQYKDSRTAVFYFHKQFIQQLNISVQRLLPYSLALGECYSFQPEKAAFHLVWRQMEMMEECIAQDKSLAYYHECVRSTIQAASYNLISLLMLHLSQQGRHPVSSSFKHGEDMFRRFILLVNQHHMRERFISFYAEQMHLTPKYLSSIIRRASGHGPAEWINQNVVLEAKNLLKHTNKSIQEVAIALNFPNQSFFGRWFKTQTGLSPKEYRNQG